VWFWNQVNLSTSSLPCPTTSLWQLARKFKRALPGSHFPVSASRTRTGMVILTEIATRHRRTSQSLVACQTVVRSSKEARQISHVALVDTVKWCEGHGWHTFSLSKQKVHSFLSDLGKRGTSRELSSSSCSSSESRDDKNLLGLGKDPKGHIDQVSSSICAASGVENPLLCYPRVWGARKRDNVVLGVLLGTQSPRHPNHQIGMLGTVGHHLAQQEMEDWVTW
jgi:hypothetical protein